MIKNHIRDWNEQKKLGFDTPIIRTMWTEESQEIVDELRNRNEEFVLYATHSTNTASHIFALQKYGMTIIKAVQFDNKYLNSCDADGNPIPALEEAILMKVN